MSDRHKLDGIGGDWLVTTGKPSVVIVDDHPLVIDALTTMLRAIHPAAEISAFESGRALSEALCGSRLADTDIVILDLGLPDADPVDLVREIRGRCRRTGIIIFSGQDDIDVIRRLFTLGARGYIPKTCRLQLLRSVIEVVLAGGTYFPPGMDSNSRQNIASSRIGQPSAMNDLSRRQSDVLELVARGLSNKEIANLLGIELGTVKIHINAVLRRLGASNRTEAARRYLLQARSA